MGFKVDIGTTTSFLAEIRGLREGLWLITKRGWNRVIIELDSETIVKTILDDTPTIGNVEIMIADCKRMINKMGTDVKIGHGLREGNKCANRLANLGQNGSCAGLFSRILLTVLEIFSKQTQEAL